MFYHDVQPVSTSRVAQLTWLLLAILLIGIGWRFVNRKAPGLPPVAPVAPLNLVQLGPLTICLDKQLLRLGDDRIELSAKESRLLKVFVTSPNTVTDRDRLMEQVWGKRA